MVVSLDMGVSLDGCVSRWVCLSVGMLVGGCIFQCVYFPVRLSHLLVSVLVGASSIGASSSGVSSVGVLET